LIFVVRDLCVRVSLIYGLAMKPARRPRPTTSADSASSPVVAVAWGTIVLVLEGDRYYQLQVPRDEAVVRKIDYSQRLVSMGGARQKDPVERCPLSIAR
jgi:hypothetical protein